MAFELTEIVQLIQSIGFPIAAYLLLYFDLRNQIIRRIERLEDAILAKTP